jgi:hypothetical protein
MHQSLTGDPSAPIDVKLHASERSGENNTIGLVQGTHARSRARERGRHSDSRLASPGRIHRL